MATTELTKILAYSSRWLRLSTKFRTDPTRAIYIGRFDSAWTIRYRPLGKASFPPNQAIAMSPEIPRIPSPSGRSTEDPKTHRTSSGGRTRMTKICMHAWH